jgi:hypothetical protein
MELKPGDEIIQNGGLFRVLRVSRHASTAVGGEVQANICEFIRDFEEGYECQIPKSWRHEWNAQGNHLASVIRISPCDPCTCVPATRGEVCSVRS